MTHVSKNKGDRFAAIFAKGSRIVAEFPALHNVLVGYSSVHGWNRSITPATAVPSWVHFEGDRRQVSRLPLPRLYTYVGRMSVHQEEIDCMQARYPEAKLAYGLRFGHAVVAGVMDHDLYEMQYPRGTSEGAIAIGYQDQEATIGLFEAETTAFHGLQIVEDLGRLRRDRLYPSSIIA